GHTGDSPPLRRESLHSGVAGQGQAGPSEGDGESPGNAANLAAGRAGERTPLGAAADGRAVRNSGLAARPLSSSPPLRVDGRIPRVNGSARTPPAGYLRRLPPSPPAGSRAGYAGCRTPSPRTAAAALPSPPARAAAPESRCPPAVSPPQRPPAPPP